MNNRNTSAIALASAELTGATKVVYNKQGVIIRSSLATTADIVETSNKKYITSSQITILDNTSGINTGDNAVNSLYSSLVGLPIGGTAGQVLSKVDGTDYNVHWVTGGGGGGDALTTNPLSQFAPTTKLQLDGVISDGDVMYIGDPPTSHTHVIADITDFGTYSTDIHLNIAALNLVSGTNTGDQTSIVGISGTKAQFNTAVSDGNIFFVDNITGTPDGTKFLKDDFSWGTPSGSGGKSINNVSTNTSAGSTSGTDYFYNCDGNITLTLPTAIGNTSKYTIKNVGTGIVTIDTTLSQLIDEWDQVTISFKNNSLDIISDGANYKIT